MSSLSKTSLISAALLLLGACGNDSNNRVIIGNGPCNLEARKGRPETDLTPFGLEEGDAAPADLDTLLNTGTLETQSIRLTYEGPTNQPGLENSVLVLAGGRLEKSEDSEGAEDTISYSLSKVCSTGFDKDLGIDEPLLFTIPMSNTNDKLDVVFGYIDYGPHLERYLRTSPDPVQSQEVIEAFNESQITNFSDILNSENARAYILKVKDEIPDSFNDETASNTFTIAYENKDLGIRYHLRVLWTPDAAEEDQEVEEEALVVQEQEPEIVTSPN